MGQSFCCPAFIIIIISCGSNPAGLNGLEHWQGAFNIFS